MKGRPRIAQEIHRISGTYKVHPERENKSAPSADGLEPEMPDYFNDDEVQKWMELVSDLRKMGVLSSDNREVMIAYCTAYGGWMAARRAIKISGIVLAGRDDNGKPEFKRNPFSVELHKYREEMNRLLPEFGLTPTSRQKLVSFQPVADDPFAAWQAEMAAG